MADVLKRDTKFDPHLVADLISKVRGKSSLAALSQQIPLAFNGNKEFIFTMDGDVDIVGESQKKSAQSVGLEPVVIRPLKFVYQARVTDELLRATEEEQIALLEAYNDGFARKIAYGLDVAAMHGLNPSTKEESNVVNDNCFDKKLSEAIQYKKEKPDEAIQAAIDKVENENDGDVTGVIISPAVATDLAGMKNANGEQMYPQFAFGGKPESIGAKALEVNKTVGVASTENESKNDCVIVGDFLNAFKWGYATDIEMEIIEYGDPDNTSVDLKGSNQVCIRSEVYIGWGILDPKSFARVANAGEM